MGGSYYVMDGTLIQELSPRKAEKIVGALGAAPLGTEEMIRESASVIGIEHFERTVLTWESPTPSATKWCRVKEEYQKACSHLIPLLERIAWQQAEKDFRYFAFLEQEYGKQSGQADSLMADLWEIVRGK